MPGKMTCIDLGRLIELSRHSMNTHKVYKDKCSSFFSFSAFCWVLWAGGVGRSSSNEGQKAKYRPPLALFLPNLSSIPLRHGPALADAPVLASF